MKKYFKKIISALTIIILLFGLVSIYKDLTETTKTKAQGTQNSGSGKGIGVDPNGPGVGVGVNPNSTGTGVGTDPNNTNNTGTTATTDSTGTDQCGAKIDCSEKEPEFKPYITRTKDETISESLKQGNIATAWALSLDLVNVLAIFVLLAIAFANILHLGERDSFSYKRMIPAFVVGLIAANLSHLISRAIIDFAGMLMNFFVPKEQAVDTVYNIIIGMFSGWFGNTSGAEWGLAIGTGLTTIVVGILFGGGFGLLIIGLIILGFPLLIMFVLWFLLAARIYVLWFLVILSPIAFFGMFFDPLKKTIGTWWNWFLMWTFIGPIAYFFIYLAEGFARNTEGNQGIICFDPADPNQVGGFTKYLIVNILLVLSVYVPYALGSKIGMGIWAGIGAFAGGLGLWAGAGTVAAGARKIGLKGAKNPFTLPALPRGMENSAAGMLWEGKRKADIEKISTDLRERMTSGGMLGRLKGKFGGWEDNMTKDDVLKFDQTGWSAEGLTNRLDTGVKEGSRKKMATALRGLYLMSHDGRRMEEQRKAITALNALKVRQEDISNPFDIDGLVGVANKSGGLEISERDDKGRVTNFKTRKETTGTKDFKKYGEVPFPVERSDTRGGPKDNPEPNKPYRVHRPNRLRR